MSRRPDEPVRLTKIYTRGGDAGQTSLGDGSRVSKLDPLVRAYGAVDELNSILGWAQVEARDPMTFSGTAAVLVAVGVLAAWVPARRAARLDPVTVLREG